jgi:hypothetical protein
MMQEEFDMTKVIGTFQEKSDVIQMVDKLKKEGTDVRNITVLMAEEGNRTITDDDIVHGVGIERLATKDIQDSSMISKMKSVFNTKDEKERREDKEDRIQELGLSEEEAEKLRKDIDKNKSYVVITKTAEEQAEAEKEGEAKADEENKEKTEKSKSKEKEEMKNKKDQGPGVVDEAPPTPEAVESHDNQGEEIKEKEEVVDKNQQKLTDRDKNERE